MRSTTKRAESPGGNGMAIYHDAPTSHTGADLSASMHSVITLRTNDSGSARGKLSGAGIVAAVTAANTYLTGLSAASRDALYAQLSGMGLTITPVYVSVPCAAGDAATLSAALATVLSTGGNVVAL
jgi:hypothetical protein